MDWRVSRKAPKYALQKVMACTSEEEEIRDLGQDIIELP